MSISIPSGAVAKEVRIHIAVSFAGAYVIPEDMEPVSPAYIIDTKNAVFCKDVEVRLQHMAKLETSEECEDKVVMKASTTPTYIDGTGPVYKFEELQGVNVKFDRGSRHFAVMKIRKFSILKVLRRLRRGQISEFRKIKYKTGYLNNRFEILQLKECFIPRGCTNQPGAQFLLSSVCVQNCLSTLM